MSHSSTCQGWAAEVAYVRFTGFEAPPGRPMSCGHECLETAGKRRKSKIYFTELHEETGRIMLSITWVHIFCQSSKKRLWSLQSQTSCKPMACAILVHNPSQDDLASRRLPMLAYLHMPKQMLSTILRTSFAKIKANAPEGNDTLLCAVAGYWDASDQLKAFAFVEVFAEGSKLWPKGREIKVTLVHILHYFWAIDHFLPNQSFVRSKNTSV